MTVLTEEEKGFIDRVRPLLESFLDMLRKAGIEPGAGSYVLSEGENIYHGVPYGTARWIHGEENAIGTMLTEEGPNARLKMILIVGAPREIIMPCGMCRMAIWKYGVENAIVLCSNQNLTTIEKFSISKLYPHPYEG